MTIARRSQAAGSLSLSCCAAAGRLKLGLKRVPKCESGGCGWLPGPVMHRCRPRRRWCSSRSLAWAAPTVATRKAMITVVVEYSPYSV